MHVLEFLSYFPFCVYVEIVKPRLPEAARILLRLGKVQAQLSSRWASPLLPHFARHSLLQHLQHRRRRASPRLADQQMHMLRHDHVTQKPETVFPADAREFSHKKISRTTASQKRQPPVATEGDEVQIASAVVTLQSRRHRNDRASGNERFGK